MDLLIDTYGTKIGSTAERIVLSFPKIKEKKEYPIHRIEKIVILRPASLTTHAVKLALDNDVDIVYLGSFGKPVGRIFSSEPRGLASLRRGQLEVSNSLKSVDLAKAFVRGKCGNQIAHVNYLGKKYKKDFDKEILHMQKALIGIDSLSQEMKSKEKLLGIEGYIADRYFHCLKKLYRFSGRKPQGRDKFNSALNYGYGILYNEIERACLYVGLDPYLGIYHSDRYGKPALILDLIEEFRVSIIDSAILPLFIEKKLTKPKCFEKIGTNEYQLGAKGKRILVEAVMKKLNTETAWQEKRYSQKAIIENQIRLIARYFKSEEKEYIPFSADAIFLQHE